MSVATKIVPSSNSAMFPTEWARESAPHIPYDVDDTTISLEIDQDPWHQYPAVYVVHYGSFKLEWNIRGWTGTGSMGDLPARRKKK